MKHLRSTSSDLRRLFDHSISVREIAEPLASFDADRDAASIRGFMEARNFDVVGVRENGIVVGYVRRTDLNQGLACDHLRPFLDGDFMPDSESLVSAIQALKERRVHIHSWRRRGDCDQGGSAESPCPALAVRGDLSDRDADASVDSGTVLRRIVDGPFEFGTGRGG